MAHSVLAIFGRNKVSLITRYRILKRLNAFSKNETTGNAYGFSRVLVDGTWDNPNYWLRYAIVRKALGLNHAKEIGIIGQHSRFRVKSAFNAFGIFELIDYWQTLEPEKFLSSAKKILSGIKTPEEFLGLHLPYDFPAQVLFDGVLKRQRRSTIDLLDQELPKHLADALAYIEAANSILASAKVDLVILSHAVDYTYGAIAWAAIRHGVPVITLYGDFGHAKFFRLGKFGDLFLYPERPTSQEMSQLSESQSSSLRDLGARQLSARLGGKTNDVGAIYAYQRRQHSITRSQIVHDFNWDSSKPIIGIYNSNWFDFPHASGLHGFRDFLDWIEVTLEVAKNRQDINWIFKAHPCDDWYGKINGVRLEDLVLEVDLPHIRLADKSWNGHGLMHAFNGIVTCHGTIGIEATAESIPVLVPYQGWYGHAGFVSAASNREDYLSRLRSDWWKDNNLEENKRRAELFAGWIYCVPSWHRSYMFYDDSLQDAIYLKLESFLDSNEEALLHEANDVVSWYKSGHPYFHMFKMKMSSDYQLDNCK